MTMGRPSNLKALAITWCKGLIPLDSQDCLVFQNTILFFILMSIWVVSPFLQEYSLGAWYWQQSTNRIRLNFVTNGSKKRGSCDFIWASLTTSTSWTADQFCSYIGLHKIFSKNLIHQTLFRAALSTTKFASTVYFQHACIKSASAHLCLELSCTCTISMETAIYPSRVSISRLTP